jgi:hypothetical protein
MLLPCWLALSAIILLRSLLQLTGPKAVYFFRCLWSKCTKFAYEEITTSRSQPVWRRTWQWTHFSLVWLFLLKLKKVMYDTVGHSKPQPIALVEIEKRYAWYSGPIKTTTVVNSTVGQSKPQLLWMVQWANQNHNRFWSDLKLLRKEL